MAILALALEPRHLELRTDAETAENCRTIPLADCHIFVFSNVFSHRKAVHHERLA